MVFQLSDKIAFPNPIYADDNGLLAIGGDMRFDRLLLAYSLGIFPWYNPDDEILWWSSPYRPVYILDKMKMSKSLKRTIRKTPFSIKVDTNYNQVILNCAAVKRADQNGTWISDEIIDAYQILFEMGYVHTVEVYHGEEMVGGLYGVSMGKAFFGESMFHLVTDASKIALHALAYMLNDWGFHFIDSQVSNPHSFRMGAIEVSSTTFNMMIKKAMSSPTTVGPWVYDFSDFLLLAKK